MYKVISGILVSFVALFSTYLVLNNVPMESKAEVHDVNLSIDVLRYLTFDITAGDTIVFDAITPQLPVCSGTASVASVVTNSANGYTLGLHDGSASDSAMKKGSVYIEDYAGTIASPTTWTGNGLGVGLWAADTNKEVKWGEGVSVCDAANTYAGVPAGATTAHTVTGYHETADTSSWSWKVDVPNSQETGAYSGNVTFTATEVLS